MTENLKKFEKALKADKALSEKFQAEAQRLVSEKLAANDGEVFVKAAKAVGFEVTPAEVEKAVAERQELDEDEMNAVTGGVNNDIAPAEEWEDHTAQNCTLEYSCYQFFRHSHEHRYDDKEHCSCDWVCAFIMCA